jgi:predicted  nucleic acid-binding Zn-ribbon protein
MGRARIISEQGRGKYTVEVQVQKGYTNNVLNRLNAKIVYVEAQIVILESELGPLEYDASNQRDISEAEISNLNDAIDAIQINIDSLTSVLTTYNAELAVLKKASPPDTSAIASKEAQIAATKKSIKDLENQIDEKEKAIDAENAKITAADLLVTEKKSQIAFSKAELVSLQKRYEAVRRLGLIDNYNSVAWCCDLTEGLSIGRYVPTIEIGTDYPEAGSSFINIFPAYEDGNGLPTFSFNEHGELLPFISLSVADALRNFCAMPAIQKWAPGFRWGTLTAIDYESNVCTVSLPYLSSRIQSLSINQSGSLTNVPIEYMYCNAGAFEVGDEVVVEFQDHDWSKPKVIGFKKQPKPCGWEEPWDGPAVTWKFPWNYRKTWVLGDEPVDATRTINNGILTFSYPDSAPGSGIIEQDHYLQYIPSDFVVTKNVSRVKFNANADMNCFSNPSGSGQDCYLAVIGFDEAGSTIISYLIYVLDNEYNTGVGCIDYPGYADTEDDDFYLYSSGDETTIWWYPGGPYPWKIYKRQIFGDKDEFMQLPEMLSTVLAIGIESHSAWFGGMVGNEPSQIAGMTMTCDIIALA